jgi:uncharacterized protein
MSFEYRFDKADLQSSVFADGFLRSKVRLTKPGVYPYTLADGTVRQEAKPPEEIYSESFLKSLDGLIVTDGHPYEFGGLVNSANYKSLMKGVILNPRIEGEFVVADEVLFDPELIESVKRGEKIEVSLGMKSDPVMESGVLFGERYDSIQTKLIANHVAHVRKGRIGPDARTILDGIQYAIKGESQMPDANATPADEPSWVKKILEGFDKLFTLFSAKAEPVTDAKPEPAKVEPANAEPKEDVASLQKQVESLKAVINSMSQNLGMKMDEAVERESLVDAVKAVLTDVDLKGKSNLQIKTELVKSQFPELKLDEKQIDVYYNAGLELAKAKAKINPGKTEIKTDSVDIESLKAGRLNLYKEAK